MNEQSKHREAFNAYWDLGPARSVERLRDVMKSHGRAPSLRTLYSWSANFHWQERILDMERDAREQDRQAQVDALRDMNERHRREGLALQQRALERFGADRANDMTPSTAIRALTEGAKLERLASGAPTEHIRLEGEVIHGHVDLRGFTHEELRRLVELAERRISGTGEAGPE